MDKMGTFQRAAWRVWDTPATIMVKGTKEPSKMARGQEMES